jgi:signal transduction histidine kinase/ActR/RegA family two-component response regulator
MAVGMARPTPETIRLHLGPAEALRTAAQAGLSPEEIAALLTSLPGTVLVVDRERRILAYSGRAVPASVVGGQLFDHVQPEHHEFYETQLRRVLDGGETVSFDVESRGEGETRRWVRVRLSPLAVGSDIRGAISLAMDIEHERAVQRRADRIRATFDYVDEGMLVVELSSGTVIESNEAAARLLQIPSEELNDTAPSWLQVTPEDGARLGWGALLDELIEGRTVRGRAILRESQEVSVELRATVRNLDDGTFAFVLCRDISRDLEKERARATQERLATVGSLAAGVAHEINNPLAYVIANVQYALDGITQWQMAASDSGPEPDRERRRAQIKEALYEANEGARRVQRIVADLKTLARQGEDRLEPIDVEKTLHWAIGVTMAEIRHRAKLVKNFDNIPPVRGDEARLGQVFVNVLLNAAQAIEPGRAHENEIIVNTSAREGRVVIEVLDTGMGIPEDNLTKIFDPFFTTKPRGVGTGLGLSICHEIIASMRGSLTAGNRSTGGARFVVELPAMPGGQAQVMRQARRRNSTPPPAQSARILIIDDEGLAAKALARILREHRVDIADHAPTGLKMALERPYDIIFCDLMMPELSGMAVHDAVEKNAPLVADRMVFVTGGTFTEEARSFAARHAGRCLFKPFDTSQVKGAIERMLVEKGAA